MQVRTFLLEKLEGNIAWRDPAQAEAQKERFAARRLAELETPTIWLKPSLIERIESLRQADNCESKSEFIEKALEFYMGYISHKPLERKQERTQVTQAV